MSSEQRIDIACGVLVLNDQNELLLIKRRLDAHVAQGLWTQPIGRLEFGETGAQAAARETLEETGVTIEIASPAPHCVAEYIKPAEGKHSIILGYLGKYVSGVARNLEPDKHDDVQWFPLTALPENLSFSTGKAIEKMPKP
jgi:8-oxo-dGTP diphosphatase